MTKNIVVFAGTRPEIIKMAPVVRELRRREQGQNRWKSHFCFSGQHLQLAVPLFEFFKLQPDSELQMMAPGQSLGQLTARGAQMLDCFFQENSQTVAALVQGDTTTAFVAALCAFYHHIPVGHVEAGLRTPDIKEPFPEELNRRLISKTATWNYAPTPQAQQNLLQEGVQKDSILMTGNTGVDAFEWASENTKQVSTSAGTPLVLITIHRRENIGEPLQRVCNAIAQLAQEFSQIEFLLPMHPNPRVKETILTRLQGHSNIKLVEPLLYGDLVPLMNRALMLMTDSGGIQEEGPSLRKPVLVMRESTERPEAIEFGTSILVGSDEEKIVSTARDFLINKRQLNLKGKSNPYGDGRAAPRIVDHLLSSLGL